MTTAVINIITKPTIPQSSTCFSSGLSSYSPSSFSKKKNTIFLLLFFFNSVDESCERKLESDWSAWIYLPVCSSVNISLVFLDSRLSFI